MRTIRVTSGTGVASTKLAAFDAALCEAGIGNFNLIPLSSVIPTGATVIEKHPGFDEEELWGHRLYVVLAESRTDVIGAEVWAGIGWIQEAESGRGLFVEHYGSSEQEVLDLIHHSLQSMRTTRSQEFGPPELVIRGVTCDGQPVSALVAAIYETQPW